MKKLILILTLVILVLSAMAAIKFADRFLYAYCRNTVQNMANQTIARGVTIQAINFETMKRSGISKIYWSGIKGKLHIKPDRVKGVENQFFFVNIQGMQCTIKDMVQGRVDMEAWGIEVTPASADSGTIFQEGLVDGYFRLSARLDLFEFTSLPSQMKTIVDELSPLLKDGETSIPVNFAGVSTFTFDGNPIRAKIFTTTSRQGNYRLETNTEFLRTIAWQMGEELTDAETSLLAANPLKLKQLFSIMQTARDESEKYRNQKSVPEDAFRHVLWSYLLTKAYGPEFAEQVTDAHEIGDASNTEAQHAMDYNNNAIGREYALRNIRRQNILMQMLNDPRVIREVM